MLFSIALASLPNPWARLSFTKSNKNICLNSTIDCGVWSNGVFSPPCVRFRSEYDPIGTTTLATIRQLRDVPCVDGDSLLSMRQFTVRALGVSFAVVTRLTIQGEKFWDTLDTHTVYLSSFCTSRCLRTFSKLLCGVEGTMLATLMIFPRANAAPRSKRLPSESLFHHTCT